MGKLCCAFTYLSLKLLTLVSQNRAELTRDSFIMHEIIFLHPGGGNDMKTMQKIVKF